MLKAIPELQSVRCGLRHPTGGDVATYLIWMSQKANRRKNKRHVKAFHYYKFNTSTIQVRPKPCVTHLNTFPQRFRNDDTLRL
jgi:hypothetical protein